MQGIGQELGLEEKRAFELLIQTFIGSSKMIRKMENTPAQLREQVTSPGGTTERALNVFIKETWRVLLERLCIKPMRELKKCRKIFRYKKD